MPDVESRFTVNVDTQGVDQARKKLDDIGKAGSVAGKGAAQAFAGTAANLDKLALAADRLISRMERMAKVMGRISGAGGRTASMPDGAQVIGNARAPSGRRVLYGPPPAVGDTKLLDEFLGTHSGTPHYGAPPAARSTAAPTSSAAYGRPQRPSAFSDFGVGLFQSAIPGNLGFLQRGPGAVAQGLGIMAGRSLGGLASIPFAGSQGLGQALSPLGPLALPFQRFMGRAESAMSLQRQQLELAPLLGAEAVDLQGGMSQGNIDERLRRGYARGESVSDLRDKLDKQRNARIDRDIARASRDPLRLMGANVTEGQAFVSQLAQAGGNRGDQMAPSFIQAAMAARTQYGVDAGTTGAFALAARTNAVAGGAGRDGTSLLLDALGQIKSLGLTGADAQTYLQQIAEGIRQFQTTGMPLQLDAMRNLTAGFTGIGGMTPLAAQRAAAGVQSASAAFLDQGPQSGADLLMLQNAGFKGGLSSFLRTKRKLGTDATAFAQSTMDTLPSLARGGDTEVAYESVRKQLRAAGISGDPRVAESYVDSVRRGENPANAFRNLVSDAQRSGPEKLSSLTSAAQALVPESVTNAAVASNRGISMGAQASGLVQDMDAMADQMAGTFSRFSGSLKTLVQMVRTVSSTLGMGDANDMAGVRASN